MYSIFCERKDYLQKQITLKIMFFYYVIMFLCVVFICFLKSYLFLQINSSYFGNTLD